MTAMKTRSYNIDDDPVVHALKAEAAADSDVIGLVVTGSRASGVVTDESDYDVIFVVTDEALDRYTRENSSPQRGGTVDPPINTTDIWHESPRTLPLDISLRMDASRVVFDRTGETTAIFERLWRMPEEEAHKAIPQWYDAYLNGMYRSLKSWRRGNELGGRVEAAQTADLLLHVLFAIEGHWRPFSSRLYLHLDKLSTQGWQPGELPSILLDLITTGDPGRQQDLARHVARLMHERGYGHVYDSWDGQIDQALAWRFD
jgi:hypothetical protein